MPDTLKLFAEPVANLGSKIALSTENAKKIGIPSGGKVEIYDESKGKKTIVDMIVQPDALDFSAKIDAEVLNSIDFDGLEITVRALDQAEVALQAAAAKFSQSVAPRPAPAAFPTTPTPAARPYTPPAPQPYVPPAPAPYSPPAPAQRPYTPPASQPYSPAPAPTPAPRPYTPPAPQPYVPPAPAPYSPSPAPAAPRPSMPGMPSAPSMGMPGIPIAPTMPGMPSVPTMPSFPGMPGIPSQPVFPGMPGAPGQQPVTPAQPAMLDVNAIAREKKGVVLVPKVQSGLTGKVKINPNNAKKLNLAEGMLVGWQDPMSQSTGAARIAIDGACPETEIWMSDSTRDETGIRADRIAVYSTEPPVEIKSALTLEVEPTPDLMGFAFLSPRSMASLQLKAGDIVTFEDALTGAIGSAKVQMKEEVRDKTVQIDSEIIEASGVGSVEVQLKHSTRPVIPLQSVDLGISPIQGEGVWQTISTARQNIDSIKGWLGNYVIFKGIKLRWKAANTACQLLDCVPSLEGDVFAAITPNTTLTLKPVGLITFNAILVIDISRSMMARDVEVTNIAPAIEGIKAAMESREIQTFMKNFKDGIAVPRRMSAAFAAILFLSEKVGRGFGEKVSIIRFADDAQILNFDGRPFMDSASGKKGILEEAAKKIVDQIGQAYGQATNMGIAMLKAQEVLGQFSVDQPTMIVILTDGVPTDGNDFFTSIQEFSKNPNVVLYIIGLGNPDDEAMKRAAAMCGGEYFKPKDSGELLVWYSKRARDLQVKLKAHHR